MTQEEINEGNIIIANGIGMIKSEYNGWSFIEDYIFLNDEHCSQEWQERLKFHESYDWLLPVLIDISKIDDIYHAGVYSSIKKYNLDILELFRITVQHFKIKNDK